VKLSNLFMIALLAGTLGVFGCSDDPPATGNGGSGGEGTAGTGGSGTAGTGGNGGSVDPDVCNVDLCLLDTSEGEALKAKCLVAYDTCITAGTQTPAQCKTIAENDCTI